MIKTTEAYIRAYSRLNIEQKKAVDQIEGPVMVVAGPGTGKTEILTTRIGNILSKTDANPGNILCLTYTDTAAVEMRKRLINYIGPLAYRIHIQTFHAFCNGVILENPDEFEIQGLELATDIDKIEILYDIIKDLDLKHPLKKTLKDIHFFSNQLKNLFEDIKKEGWEPAYLIQKTREEIEKQSLHGPKIKRKERFIAAVELYESYIEKMIEKRRYDFDDMILWVIKAFKKNEELLLNYQEKYEYILVDEFQDTSGSQFELLDLLTSYWENPNLFVVGDDDQSVFRFQGANVENVIRFYDKYKDHLQLIILKDNYRSSQNILNLISEFISGNTQRLGNSIGGIDFDKNLISANKKVAEFQSLPKTISCENPQQEAIYVVKTIEKIIRRGETPLSEIAVLYSKNKQSDEIRLILEKKRIPYQISQKVNILDSFVIKSLILIAKYINSERKNPFKNDHLLFEILHLPYFKISPLVIDELTFKLRNSKLKKEYHSLRQLIKNANNFAGNDLFSSAKNDDYEKITQLSRYIEEWIQLVNNDTLPRIFERVLNCGILAHIVREEKQIEMLEDIESFFAFLKRECNSSPGLTLDHLIEKIEILGRLQLKLFRNSVIGSTEGIVLSTVHSAKGKEFEYVFMIGCIKNNWERNRNFSGFSFPENLFRKNDSDDDEERRRLFYVGMSRAKRYLYISQTKRKDEISESIPSLFFTEVCSKSSVDIIDIAIPAEEQLPYILEKYSRQEEPVVSLLNASLIKDRLENYSLSVSHLNKFLECPLKFYYEQILKVPVIENAAMAFGSVIHSTLENYFRSIKKGRFPQKELLLHLFEKEMELKRGSFHEKEYEMRFKRGFDVLSNYYDERREHWNPDVKLEEKFLNIMLDGCMINGKVDKIEFKGKNAVLIDYKTGNYENDLKKYKNFARPGEGKLRKNDKFHIFEYGGNYWRQAVFYKLLVLNDPNVDWNLERVEFEYLEPDKSGNIPSPHPVFVSNEDLEIVRGQIRETYRRIRDLEFQTGCGADNCNWCRHAKAYSPNKEILLQKS